MEKAKTPSRKVSSLKKTTVSVGIASAVLISIELNPVVLREILRLLEVALHLAFARS